MKRFIILAVSMAALSACVTYTASEPQPKPQKSSKAQKNREAQESSEIEDSGEDTNQAAINGAVDVLNNAIFWGSVTKR